jgi:hypothetical protein
MNTGILLNFRAVRTFIGNLISGGEYHFRLPVGGGYAATEEL